MYAYQVDFAAGGYEVVHANTPEEAIILAQAKRIEKRLDWRHVTRAETIS